MWVGAGVVGGVPGRPPVHSTERGGRSASQSMYRGMSQGEQQSLTQAEVSQNTQNSDDKSAFSKYCLVHCLFSCVKVLMFSPWLDTTCATLSAS